VDNAVSERGGETTRLGSFEIVRKLARGGMAEIFLARTRGPSGFEKLVVLKKILPKYAGKPRFVQLFLEEAKLAATLDHPNIAQVYDIGMVDGSYFFTMEYLHGQDVRSILHRAWRNGEKFPIEHAVQIARHVASALHFAHEKPRNDGTQLGIVHRDVSPSNIIVTYDGATKLLDFGVAKTAASSVKTRTGALKGKVAYMSPEQARGAALDRRSDIFSLGIVLWEMVTTQRLYRGENDLATLQLIITQPAKPPTTVRPDCPPELERIVMRALADDLGARYATAEQLVTDLDELAREHKLKQSPNALAATMNQLFSAELASWREARAAGVQLADHLQGASDMTAPVSESDFIEVDAILEEDDDEDEDELDDVEDDNEKTEHAAPFIDLSAEDPRPAGKVAGAPTPRGVAAQRGPAGDAPRPAGTPGPLTPRAMAAQRGPEGGAPRPAGKTGPLTPRAMAAQREPAGKAPRAADKVVGKPPPRDAAAQSEPMGKGPRAGNAIGSSTLRDLAAHSEPLSPLASEPMLPEEPESQTLRPGEFDAYGQTLRPGEFDATMLRLGDPDGQTLQPGELDATVLRLGDLDGQTLQPGELDATVLRLGDLDGQTLRPSELEIPTSPSAVPLSEKPTTASAPVTGRHPAPSAPMTGRPPTPSAPFAPFASASGVYATPSVPFAAVSPLTLEGAAVGSPAAAPSVPLAAIAGAPANPGAPFAVPPWQSGRPPQALDERTARSWAVVELPPFDPEAFERRRRIVLRVAGGLVGFIFLLAILAGHC
jgi:serine/threonine protein kinase